MIGEDGNTITEGAVKINDGESIIAGGTGKTITNPADSGDDEIIVTPNSPQEGKDTIKVPAGGKVKIADKEYEASDKGVTLAVDRDGNVTVIAGSLKGDKDSDNNKDKDKNSGNNGNSDKDKNADDDTDSSSKTGDDTNVLGLLAVLTLAGAGAGTVFIRRRHS